ncbi:hypothetical protein AOZ06_48525 [Kibdelosporangium phytohabitans]|uniref:Gram-positive cocci surface proteins LPxTG domain-containing protein n=1 Tax=Kibdelosporangium phytohabitans TaxID=860235 RepID=A0A0N9IB48_9PSEU|nr:hypothetical protein AOZ06_48525 [Kibdelosporangium phytohabitans]
MAGLVGAGVLILGAPIAMADTDGNPAPAATSAPAKEPTTAKPAPTDSRVTTSPQKPAATRSPEQLPPPGKPAVDKTGRAVKPVGAPETGGGMEESTSNTGALVIGGIALVAVASGGTAAYRRLRKQS